MSVALRVGTFAVGALTLVLSAGCGAADRANDGVVVRDSAGVILVESHEAIWADGIGWRVEAEPALRIGTVEGSPEMQLFRVVGATRLPDGRIVIANAGSHELRLYDSSGGHLVSVGGEGEGPGEFRSLAALHRFGGDSLFAYDQRLDRLSVFDGGGHYVRSFTLEQVAEVGAHPLVPLGDDRLLAVTRSLFRAGDSETGLISDSAAILVFSMDGAVRDTIGRFPTSERFIWTDGRMVMGVPYPFARTAMYEAGDGHIYFGWSGSYEIRAYSWDGLLERIVRRPGTERPVTSEDVTRFKEDVLAGSRSEAYRQRLAGIYQEISVPEVLPALFALVVDTEGYLWVERYRRPGEVQHVWDVFEPSGRWIGALELPRGLKVFEIGRDYVLGLWRDDMEVEQVLLYRLVREA